MRKYNIKNIINTIKKVFRNRKYLYLELILFISFTTIYFFTLPATYTGGYIGLISLRFLNLKLIIISLILSFLISLIITFTIFSIRKQLKTKKGKSSSITAFVTSIIPSFVCCTPILPSLISAIILFFPSFSIFIGIEGFIATYETQIYIIVILFLIYSLFNISYTIEYNSCKIKK